MFRFNIEQEVKVIIYNKVVSGTIVLRQLLEDSKRVSITYTIQCGLGEIDVSEKYLIETQLLNLGEIYDRPNYL